MTNRNTVRPIWYVAFSLAVTAGVLGYIFSHITWQQVVGLITGMDRKRLAFFFLFSFAMHMARMFRYDIILRSVGERTGRVRLFLAVLVRSMCVDMLPARIGELVYVYILRVRLGVDLGAASASFALAFLFDFMALAPLIVTALILVGAGVSISPALLIGASLGMLAVAALLIHFLPAALRLAFFACARFRPLSARARGWLLRLMAGTHRQVFRARQSGVYMPVFLLSIAVRLLKYGSLYMLLLAMLAPHGYDTGNLPFPKVFLGLCSAEMSASLPISGIGGFGAYQGAWSLVFTMLGYPSDLAQATSVSHHVFTQLYGFMLGVLSLALLLLFRPGRREPASPGK